MNITRKKVGFIFVLSLVFSNGCVTAQTQTDVYVNNFSDRTLDDFIVTQEGSAQISIEDGRLRIDPGEGYLNRGIIAIDMNDFTDVYQSVLSENSGKIIYAFNVSNIDGSSCGGCNNSFALNLFSRPDTDDPSAFGYTLSGGGYVGEQFRFFRHALALSKYGSVADYLIIENNGLGNAPQIGAFRLEYTPDVGSWMLYFESSTEMLDPLSITQQVGHANDSEFAGDALPYVILSSENKETAFFDNFSVIIVTSDSRSHPSRPAPRRPLIPPSRRGG
jgi:hypothetical protein